MNRIPSKDTEASSVIKEIAPPTTEAPLQIKWGKHTREQQMEIYFCSLATIILRETFCLFDSQGEMRERNEDDSFKMISQLLVTIGMHI